MGKQMITSSLCCRYCNRRFRIFGKRPRTHCDCGRILEALSAEDKVLDLKQSKVEYGGSEPVPQFEVPEADAVWVITRTGHPIRVHKRRKTNKKGQSFRIKSSPRSNND